MKQVQLEKQAFKIIPKKFIHEFYNSAFNSKCNETLYNTFKSEGLHEPVSSEFLEILCDYKVGSMLDVGYGYGNYSIVAAKKGFRVTAIDQVNPNYLNRRLKIEDKKLKSKISIIQKNIINFTLEQNYDVIIAKDVLHYLSKYRVDNLFRKFVEKTNLNGTNYFTIFVNIKRLSIYGENLKIQGEAGYKVNELMDSIEYFYRGWDLKINLEDHLEFNHKGFNENFDFYGLKVTVIAKKTKKEGGLK